MDTALKACTRCGCVLPRSAFAEHKGRIAGKCGPCDREYHREYRAANRERQRELHAKWRQQNLSGLRERSKKWRDANPEKMQAMRGAWAANNPDRVKAINERSVGKRKVRADYKVNNRVRSRIRRALREGGHTGAIRHLDYTVSELMAHLERQFVKGMGWHNMDKWHIDHIVPLSSFTITGPDDPELRRAWALTNLRPLWAKQNLKKSSKVEFLI